MSTQKFQLHISGFRGGLNTEASVLNVLPSELMSGSKNVELLQNGDMRRRRGVDFVGQNTSGGYLETLRSSTKAEEASHESPAAVYAKLTAPNGTTVERIIVDLNDKFLIYKTDKNSLSNIGTPFQTITRSWSAFGTTVTKSVDDQKFYNMQFAQSGNRVFFTGLKCHPGYLSVNADNETLDITFLDVLIRDPSAQTTNTRLGKSAGDDWYECIEAHTSSSTNEPGTGTEWQRYWFLLDGDQPTSPDLGSANWATSTAYTSTFIKRYDKYVDATSSDTYPTAIAFYAGRLWLAGDPKHPNDVLFTQVFTSDADLEKFHQYADPFDTADPDLVDDDGGVISLQGSGLTKDMVDIGSALFIGSDKGVWQLKGQDQIFKATNFSSDRVLTEAVLSHGGMLAADNTVFVFGENNIWRADFDNTSGGGAIGLANFRNFSETKLESFYNGIPTSNKEAAWAVYNPTDRKVYYFFNETNTQFILSYGKKKHPGYYTRVLVMDVRTHTATAPVSSTEELDQQRRLVGAFYLYEMADGGSSNLPYMAFPLIAPDTGIADNQVVAGADTVQSASGVNNVVAVGGTESGSAVFFIAMQRVTAMDNVTVKHAFAKLKGSTLRDWESDSTYAVSFDSKAFTGVQTMGDVLHKKMPTYLFFVFKRVETGTLESGVDTNPGGCFLRTAWQWATSTTSPKYSGQTQIYKPERYGLTAEDGTETHDHVWWKHRARGRGNAMQVILESDGNKDFHLIGWSQQFYGKLD